MPIQDKVTQQNFGFVCQHRHFIPLLTDLHALFCLEHYSTLEKQESGSIFWKIHESHHYVREKTSISKDVMP